MRISDNQISWVLCVSEDIESLMPLGPTGALLRQVLCCCFHPFTRINNSKKLGTSGKDSWPP